MILTALKLPKSTYYDALKNIYKEDSKKEIKDKIEEIYHKNKGRYGHRRIRAELLNQGIKLNKKTVLKYMKELNLNCKIRVVKYNSYKGTVGRIAPNLLERNFVAENPNEKWVTDVTQINFKETKIFLSPIIDLYNGEVISHNISLRPNMNQINDMLDKAFAKIDDNTDLILHSDQGWQYQMKDYSNRLKGKGIRQSMSRKANCLDNAVAESWFGTLKTELIYSDEIKKIQTLEELIQKIEEYIKYYNEERIKEKLDGKSPVQYRLENAA